MNASGNGYCTVCVSKLNQSHLRGTTGRISMTNSLLPLPTSKLRLSGKCIYDNNLTETENGIASISAISEKKNLCEASH